VRRGVAGAAILLLLPVAAAGQGFPDVESEMPLPSLTGTEARAMGMGGAGIAIAEDGSAVYWNPAGLAQMRRIEISGSVAHDRTEITNTWEGFSATSFNRSTNLGSFHLVYPFPTYRGSVVLELGVDQFRNYDFEYERHTIEGGSPQRIDKHDTISESGKLNGWSIGLAVEASPRLYLGAAMFLHSGEDLIAVNQITTDLDNANPDTLQLDDLIETEADITGITGNFGFLYRLSRNLRFGATVKTTTNLTFEGVQRVSLITVEDNGNQTELFDEVFFEDQITFPASFGFGVAMSIRGLTVAGDARYTDWTQVTLDESPFRSQDLSNRFQDKTSYYAGGEWIVFGSPIRLRGGYTWDPVPYQLVYQMSPKPFVVAIDRDQEFVTAGAGLLLDTVFTIDAAAQIGSFTRESALYSEEREFARGFLSAAYRF
jgi:long-subunit fatty acid transport protein